MRKHLLASLAIFAATTALAEKPKQVVTGRSACSSGESWTFTSDFREDFVKEFNASLSSKLPVRGFAQAMGLRKLAQSYEQKLFAEYWVSRSLHEAGLMHIAHSGFASVAAHEPKPETIGIQAAALECMLRIEDQYPAMALPQSVTSVLPAYVGLLKGSRNLPIAWEAVHSSLRAQLASQAPAQQIDRSIALLAGSGDYESLGKAFWAVKRGAHGEAIRELQKFFQDASTPAPLKRFQDTAHLMLARSLYTQGAFEKAMNEYKLVSKRSNELADSLSELSWTYLMAEKYSEAIGTATNLQQGGLRKTFAPEAPMVMSMALNELCQYPESVRATNLFKKLYEEPYRWLTKWNQDPSRRDGALYALAVDFLKKKKENKTPDRIASEWVRSPTFISSQEEINLLFEEQGGTSSLGRSGSSEQSRAARETIRMIVDLKPRFKAAKAQQKAGQPLPKQIVADLRAIKQQLIYFRRLQHAAPVWRNVLANYQKQVPAIRTHLLAQINDDLTFRTRRMLSQLDEIAENIQLVEVEIFNGASQDIIWQNAHPDYKQVAQKMKDDHEKVGAAKVWDWGRTIATADNGEVEIWEDELGSFKADLFDNCSSKDRYLALRAHSRGN